MSKFRAVILTALLAAGAVFAQGDTLQMGGATGAFDAPGKPTRGMTEDQVRATYGSPQKTVAAVGEPPISRWEYTDFVVFFEYDRVIHAVTRR